LIERPKKAPNGTYSPLSEMFKACNVRECAR
jgi:hypothetical protein